MGRRALVILGILGACRDPRVAPLPATRGTMRIEAPRTGVHASARTGDLEIFDARGAAVVVAVAPAATGHRPLAGAIVDLLGRPRDDAAADPLDWWRIGWVEGTVFHPPSSVSVAQEGDCAVIDARAEPALLKTTVCPLAIGFSVRTETSMLPDGASVADEIQVTMSATLLDDDGGAWGGQHTTRWVSFSQSGLAATLDAGEERATASRQIVHFDDEAYPPPIIVRHGRPVVERRLVVSPGDALASLADAGAPLTTETVDLGPRGGTFSLLTRAGRELFRGTIRERRVLGIPEGLSCDLQLRDSDGIPLGAPRRIGSRGDGAPSPRGTFHFDTNAPVHVLFKGTDGTPDPQLAPSAGAIASGYSIYAVLGHADVVLPVGHYDVTATAGPLATLDHFPLAVEDGRRTARRIVVTPVERPDGFIAADFHLHAAPSRDASVSLAERAASLACESIDVAVATDHDRVTDYGPALAALGLERPIAIVGDEITTAGKSHFGHFNVFPLPLPRGPPEDGVPPYWEMQPARVAPAARAMGARVVQVNHPHMPHAGFFDFARLDAATGQASGAFTDDFDALEVLNGFFLEQPEKLRAGAIDLVALARRGKRVAATGNSDSHGLMYQEPGYPRTWVRIGPGANPATFAQRTIDALLRGDTVASSGALLDVRVEGKPPGSIVRPKDGKVHVVLRAYAAAWVPIDTLEVWRDDTVAFSAAADPPRDGLRITREVDIDVSRDAVILVWASSAKPLGAVLPQPDARAVSVTTPVYVDADGDGRVISAPR